MLRLVWREIGNHKRFTLLFLCNLALGLCGFLTIDGFRSSVSEELGQQSRNVLSADLEVSMKRPLTTEEIQTVESKMPQGFTKANLLSMYSMVGTRGKTRLVQVRAVGPHYPLYGAIQVKDQPERKIEKGNAWVYPELLSQLNLKLGDRFSLGSAEFVVDGVIHDDPQSLMAAATLAPRIYIPLEQVGETDLVRTGSTVWYSYFYKLPRGVEALPVREAIFESLNDPGIKVVTHTQASRQVSRLLDYLIDYLGLVALAAMMLSSVGLAFLFRTYLSSRVKDMAILMSLGWTPREVKKLFVFQVMLLGALSALPALVVGRFVLPSLGVLAEKFVPLSLELSVPLLSYVMAFVLAVLGSLLACYPLIRVVDQWRPILLLREEVSRSSRLGLKDFVAWVPLLIVYWLLSMWQAKSFFIGSVAFLAFAGSGLLFVLLGSLIIRAVGKIHVARLYVRLALRQLGRRPFASVSCFLAISLGTLLVNVVFQIKASLQAEIEQPESSKLPSLFLFDIQEEQVDPLLKLAKEENTEIQYLSPLVRARIISVNGESFDKGAGETAFTREEESEMRFRNRGFNLSYRGEFSDSETLVEGRPFSGNYQGGDQPAEISVEHWFAERLKLKMGDVLEFDVQGIPVKGKIVSMRKVRWSSFQPNFFVQFQPGVLEEAPKTFIGAIPKLSVSRKQVIQDKIVELFGNISMVDVGRVVDKIGEIVDRMLLAIQLMAVLALLVGYLVLYSIAMFQARERRWDVNLMKILGATFSSLKHSFWLEFGLLGGVAAVVGSLLSIGVGILMSDLLFDGVYAIDWLGPLMSPVLVGGLCVFVSHLAVATVLRQRPSVTFQLS